MNVFTYGTLMFPKVWQAVVGRPFSSVEGYVTNYAVYRVRDAAFPGLLATTTGQTVRGVVYLDVDDAAVDRLDLFEDDYYERLPVTVACDDGILRLAEAYVVPNENRDVLTDEAWSPDEFVARGDLQQFLQRFAGFQRLTPDGN